MIMDRKCLLGVLWDVIRSDNQPFSLCFRKLVDSVVFIIRESSSGRFVRMIQFRPVLLRAVSPPP